MDRIVLFLPNWIGDVVMATPAIRAVRERFPTAHLAAVCKSYVKPLLDGAPWFQETILCDKKSRWEPRVAAAVRQLRRHRFDAAVLFTHSFRTALIAWLGGCRRRFGYARNGRSLMLSDRVYPVRDHFGRLTPSPIIDDYNRLVKLLGVREPGHRLELFTTPEDELAANRVWEEERLDRYPEVIGLNSGGAYGAAKHWPVEHFAELARTFADQRGSGVLVLCGPNERELAQKIVELAGRKNVVSLADRNVSIGLTKACVRRLDLLVTTDSGPRHFAAAFNRPVVTLFGPTFIEWTETYFAMAKHVQKKVPCGPCQLRVCPLDHACMRGLSVADVWQAAIEQLSKFPPVPGGLRHAG